MANEKVPVLTGAIPSIERMMTRLEKLAKQAPGLAPAINKGLKSAYKYYKWMDDCDAYIIIICESCHLLFASLFITNHAHKNLPRFTSGNMTHMDHEALEQEIHQKGEGDNFMCSKYWHVLSSNFDSTT